MPWRRTVFESGSDGHVFERAGVVQLISWCVRVITRASRTQKKIKWSSRRRRRARQPAPWFAGASREGGRITVNRPCKNRFLSKLVSLHARARGHLDLKHKTSLTHVFKTLQHRCLARDQLLNPAAATVTRTSAAPPRAVSLPRPDFQLRGASPHRCPIIHPRRPTVATVHRTSCS